MIFTLSEGLYCDFKGDKLPGDEARSPRLGPRADHIYNNSIATNKNPRKGVQVTVFS